MLGCGDRGCRFGFFLETDDIGSGRWRLWRCGGTVRLATSQISVHSCCRKESLPSPFLIRFFIKCFLYSNVQSNQSRCASSVYHRPGDDDIKDAEMVLRSRFNRESSISNTRRMHDGQYFRAPSGSKQCDFNQAFWRLRSRNCFPGRGVLPVFS
jgi:hypothetical protein